MALPPAFRSTIGEICYLTFGEDACVKVLSDEAFRAEAQKMIDDVNAGLVSRSRQRAFSASVHTVSPDKQGRIQIEAALRDYAGIEANAPVVLLGALDRIEVWTPEEFARETSVGADELAGAPR